MWRLVGGILTHRRRFVQGFLPEKVTAPGFGAKRFFRSADQAVGELAGAGDREASCSEKSGQQIKKYSAVEQTDG